MNPKQVNMHEAKSRLSELGELVWKGEKVVIAKAGKPYLDLLPHRAGRAKRKPGRLKGQIFIADDFDETPPEVIADFEGQE
jgi:antitoxin (DNA-binding transcriptional repressor) of toxin-antitoxin stability system